MRVAGKPLKSLKKLTVVEGFRLASSVQQEIVFERETCGTERAMKSLSTRTRGCNAEAQAESAESKEGAREDGAIIGDSMTGSTAAPCGDCAEILDGLNNVLAGVLLNAQMLEWKLPSYSRSKRYLHEIERNAQRGGELVKRLSERVPAGCSAKASSKRGYAGAPTLASGNPAMVSRESGAAVQTAVSPSGRTPGNAPVVRLQRRMVAVSHDSVTSALAMFPKKGR